MNTDTVLIIIAIIGCFVGLAGWLSQRDKKNEHNAEWRGKTDATLTSIRNDLHSLNANIAGRVEALEENLKDRIRHSDSRFEEHSIQIAEVKGKADSAHKRIDSICDSLRK